MFEIMSLGEADLINNEKHVLAHAIVYQDGDDIWFYQARQFSTEDEAGRFAATLSEPGVDFSLEEHKDWERKPPIPMDLIVRTKE